MIWFPMSAAIFLLMVVQTFGGAYGDQEQAAWGWALPNFLPTLALMGSVFAAGAVDPEENKISVVRQFFFRLAFWVSIFYFLILVIVLFAPVALDLIGRDPATPQARLAAMARSNIFLGPLQSFVVGMIGVLFILKGQAAIEVQLPGGGG